MNIKHSYSKKGYPYDNASMESFNAILKKEEVNQKSYVTFEEARLAIFEFIERYGYKDIEILKSKLNLFFYKGSSNIEDLVEENEKAIEFLRSNESEKRDNENNNKN